MDERLLELSGRLSQVTRERSGSCKLEAEAIKAKPLMAGDPAASADGAALPLPPAAATDGPWSPGGRQGQRQLPR